MNVKRVNADGQVNRSQCGTNNIAILPKHLISRLKNEKAGTNKYAKHLKFPNGRHQDNLTVLEYLRPF